MKKIIDYTILENEDRSQLEYEVQGLLANGHQLHGDLNVVPVLYSEDNRITGVVTKYIQCMIKYEDE